MVIIVMGVSASGKTEVGTILAEQIGGTFYDADDYHSPANKEKMRQQIPLTDDDRKPWLQTLRGLIEPHMDTPNHAVLACSALKAVYRYELRIDQRQVGLAFLKGDAEGLYQRLQERKHEYFKGLDNLLHQLCTLEEPHDWENALVLDRTKPWEENAGVIKTHYGL